MTVKDQITDAGKLSTAFEQIVRFIDPTMSRSISDEFLCRLATLFCFIPLAFIKPHIKQTAYQKTYACSLILSVVSACHPTSCGVMQFNVTLHSCT